MFKSSRLHLKGIICVHFVEINHAMKNIALTLKEIKMNKSNLLTAIELLNFAIKINRTMISAGHALTGKPFTEQEELDLQSEIVGAEEGIDVLEDVIHNINKQEEAIKTMSSKVFI